MCEKLAGKTALITGSASGIGRAIAEEFSKEGANVVLMDYQGERSREILAEIESGGGTGTFVEGDVSSADNIDGAISLAISTFGQLDILVNNAGVFDHMAPCIEATDELWDRLIGINLKGTFLGMRRALQEMLPHKAGSIINMSSIAGLGGRGGGTVYSAAKSGIVGLTKQVACEVASDGIRVNALAPGLVFTNLFENSPIVLGEASPTGPLAEAATKQLRETSLAEIPMGRGASPAEVARAAVFLASEDSSYVTGHVLLVEGGLCAK